MSCSFNPIYMTWIKVEIFSSLIKILLVSCREKEWKNSGKTVANTFQDIFPKMIMCFREAVTIRNTADFNRLIPERHKKPFIV